MNTSPAFYPDMERKPVTPDYGTDDEMEDEEKELKRMVLLCSNGCSLLWKEIVGIIFGEPIG